MWLALFRAEVNKSSLKRFPLHVPAYMAIISGSNSCCAEVVALRSHLVLLLCGPICVGPLPQCGLCYYVSLSYLSLNDSHSPIIIVR
jgi:hypothetical protein